MTLDAASPGNFNTRSSKEARQLIEKLVSSNITKNTDAERTKSTGTDANQIAEVTSKIDFRNSNDKD